MSIRVLLGTLLATLLVSACSVYDDYGYGRVANSKMGPDEATPLVLPANAISISQRYWPDPGPALTSQRHRGFDIFAPARTPVLAAGDGEISRVRTSILYGRQIMLDHGRSGAGYRIQTRYFHLAERVVEEGQQVRRGDLLGYSGASGIAGVYPHLHFEVHRLNEATPPVAIGDINPQLFWVDGVGKITCYDSARDYPLKPVRLTYPVPCRDVDWH